MSRYVGADPAQLDVLGQQLLGEAQQLDELRLSLTGQLYETGWAGADAEHAQSGWETTHAPALGAAAELLRNTSQTLFANAGQQRDASTADGTMTLALFAPRGPGGPGPDPDSLRDYWLRRASDKAGIDLSAWDPTLGANALHGTITDVYTYYGNLFLQNPYMQWAGMANMVGPSFAAGFFDLAMLRDLAKMFEGKPGVPPGMSELARLTDEELRYYETTFLTMQKKIFEDQAMMHEAYLGGGMDAIYELRDAHLIDQGTADAWAQIDEGRRLNDESLIQQGNERLLLREQRDVIDRYYQQMYDHFPTGPAFTYLMTAVGEPSIPGAHSFGDYKPVVITTETPGPHRIPFTSWDNPFQGDVVVRTPFPDGNIANFDDRWDYITHDTLPAYQQFLHDHPDQARALVASDVDARIEDYRIYNRIDSLAEHYGTDWGVGFHQ